MKDFKVTSGASLTHIIPANCWGKVDDRSAAPYSVPCETTVISHEAPKIETYAALTSVVVIKISRHICSFIKTCAVHDSSWVLEVQFISR